MNNRDMLEFAKYFSEGVTKGVDAYHKARQTAIQAARNEVLERDRIAQQADRSRRTEGYLKSVENQGILARARAQKLAGVGAGVGAGMSPQAKALIEKYQAEGADMSQPRSQALTVNVQGTGDTGDIGVVNPPGDSGGVSNPDGMRKGGMVKKFARGGMADQTGYGISGDMTLEEAEKLAEKKQAKGQGGGATGSMLGSAANIFSKVLGNMGTKSTGTPPFNPNAPAPDMSNVTAVGPQGSGLGGTYQPADFQPGGVGYTGYRQGGSVRRYARGGRVVPQAIDTGTSGPGSGFGVPAAPPAGARVRPPAGVMGGRNA